MQSGDSAEAAAAIQVQELEKEIAMLKQRLERTQDMAAAALFKKNVHVAPIVDRELDLRLLSEALSSWRSRAACKLKEQSMVRLGPVCGTLYVHVTEPGACSNDITSCCCRA